MGRSSKPPPAPDYAALAQQQAALNKDAATEQTVANRPTQVTPWGTSSWSQNSGTEPNYWGGSGFGNLLGNLAGNAYGSGGGDGQWTQTITLNPAEQAALDQEREFTSKQQGFASNLLDQAGQSLSQPMSLQGLPEMQGYNLDMLRGNTSLDSSGLPQQGGMGTLGLPELSDMDLSGMNRLDPGFGAVEAVRDAMMGRMAPARQQSRNAEIQRLKNQGIPENSEAFQRSLQRLDQGDTDAQQQALLGAAGEYGNIFNRGLSANNQQLQQQQAIAALRGNQRGQLFTEQGVMADLANANRSQQFGERQSVADFNQRVRGQQFGEQGQQAQLAGMLRQQALAEQDKLRQAPMNDFLRLTQGTNPTMPQMPSFMAGTGAPAADMYGAGQQQYNAAMNNYNASQARGAGLTSGLFGLAGAALGGPVGGKAGSFIGGLFGK